ncbi:hypothetical protein CXF85_10190 [Colwellia sp. 75C3]|uniref:hypothetical protein n=1 Tax=Colwellia sp. 75C3 TaxID=888425 RepID=UPI000C342F04|nr:hypothetical protein [Colwellia sp. 75C3]PKG83858.1 hypothetical protein CXF85_10190 [Colwellia sp. 75C3]
MVLLAPFANAESGSLKLQCKTIHTGAFGSGKEFTPEEVTVLLIFTKNMKTLKPTDWVEGCKNVEKSDEFYSCDGKYFSGDRSYTIKTKLNRRTLNFTKYRLFSDGMNDLLKGTCEVASEPKI